MRLAKLGWLGFLLAGVLPACTAIEEGDGLYPEIEPLATGYLQVSELHEIYWETCGNPDGIPVFVLHGGPGGMASPGLRRYFDPQRFFMVLHDQRGGGRSRPLAEWRDNTT
ncbi:MAG: hypothetical protein ABIF77_22320 [bacterium]